MASGSGVREGVPLAAREALRGWPAARATLGFLRDPIAEMSRLAGRHGRLFAVGQARWLGEREHLYAMALGPEYNQRVLGDPETFRTTGQGLSGPRGSALRRIRNGLTRSRGEKHARMRSLLAPHFQPRGIEAAWPRIVEIVERRSSRSSGWEAGASVDLVSAMRDISLGVSSDALFGIEDPADSAEISERLRYFAGLSFSPSVLALAVDFPGTPFAKLARTAEGIEARVQALIELRRARAREFGSGSAALLEVGGGTDVISRMIAAVDEDGGWLGEADLVGQVTLLFAASHETTASALSWCFFVLSQFPEVCGALREELRAELRGAPMRTDQAGKLPLLDAVVKEVLRLLPPVPYTLRTTTRDLEEHELGLALRRGDTVFVSHYYTHHMPEVWSQPERFDPERWMQGLRPAPAEYLPFSMAPRICIGANFATTVIKVVLSQLLQRFAFEVADGQRVDREVRVTMGIRGRLDATLRSCDARTHAGGIRGNVREMVELPR